MGRKKSIVLKRENCPMCVVGLLRYRRRHTESWYFYCPDCGYRV